MIPKIGDFAGHKGQPELWPSQPQLGLCHVETRTQGTKFPPRGSPAAECLITLAPLLMKMNPLGYAKQFWILLRGRFDANGLTSSSSPSPSSSTRYSSSTSEAQEFGFPSGLINFPSLDRPDLSLTSFLVTEYYKQEPIYNDFHNLSIGRWILCHPYPNCIILAISPANQDIATSDVIKLARDVDPSVEFLFCFYLCERTFGVLTKLDLMDKGTNATEVLEGRSYRRQHPWVGVVNRSQADINKNYFTSNPDYGDSASKMGSECLAKLLSKHFVAVIKSRIPSITSMMKKTIDDLEREMDHLGGPIALDAGGNDFSLLILLFFSKAQLYTILELCRAFVRIFKEHLDGGRPGGNRIYGVFDNRSLLKVVSEADDYQPHLIAPEQGYQRLIDGALNYFRGPAEASVDAVHFVLNELVRKSLSETQELKRFPTRTSEIAVAANEALETLVDMESSYLTADFFRKLPQEVEKAMNPPPQPQRGGTAPPDADRYNRGNNNMHSSPVARYLNGHFRRIGSNVSVYIGMVSETLTVPGLCLEANRLRLYASRLLSSREL
ncbi:dynamin GTPase [Ranunculus cassubicifolius]